MVILRKTYMLSALIYSAECMRVLSVFSSLSMSNATEHHVSLFRGRLSANQQVYHNNLGKESKDKKEVVATKGIIGIRIENKKDN